MKKKTPIEVHAATLAAEHKLTYEVIGNFIAYKTIGGSDSVQVIHDVEADFYFVEIFPIDQGKEIVRFPFRNDFDAFQALKVWRHYMNVVVYELHKEY